ncbi:tRNA pseudouridine synthase A [Maribacter sp. X9]|uniref:tRNA pseudouridine synthase A n=1 Tax=Maribacter sp. X9 TaxID=3402159 RepID=UPI003AF3F123
MDQHRFRYLVRLQYLGFRYSGWQIQPKQRTVEAMLNKTFTFLYPDVEYKILGAGRTDAKVSALDGAFELFLAQELENLNLFLMEFNKNLPPDIRLLSIQPKQGDFNIIKDSKTKEYLYLFSYGQKNHPFSAPFISNYTDYLDLERMKMGAMLFEGTHDFSIYTAELKPNTKTVRHIDSCYIEENNLLKANFFPEKSFILKIRGKGFMRYQIRMIMGALVQLGKNELTLAEIEASLKSGSGLKLKTIAPGSGLLLNQISFKG